MDMWLVWVPGKQSPKKLHASKEAAVTEAKRLRTETTGREVYVFEAVEIIPGRKVLSIKNGNPNSRNAVTVEPIR
jgi:hypothetical protein